MKVVMFIASSLFGGAETVVVDLSNALALHGVEVVVVAFDGSVWLNRLSDDIKVHRLTCSQGRYNPRLYLQLRKIIIRERPDIVHSHGAKASEVISRVAALTPILQVATKHNSRKGKIFNKLNNVIAVSGMVANSVQQPVEVIFNGVKKRLDIQPSRPDCGSFQVLGIGRLDPIKRFDWLIREISQLPDNFTLEIVGEGAARGELTRQINALGVGDRVKLLGHQDNIAELMASRHAVVVASISEGFSLVIAEALFYANLSAATEVGIAPELFPEAFLIKEGALGEKLQEMEANFESMSSRFRSFANQCSQNFEMGVVAQKHLDYYRAKLASNKG